VLAGPVVERHCPVEALEQRDEPAGGVLLLNRRVEAPERLRVAGEHRLEGHDSLLVRLHDSTVPRGDLMMMPCVAVFVG
jgi:hypothetical protein